MPTLIVLPIAGPRLWCNCDSVIIAASLPQYSPYLQPHALSHCVNLFPLLYTSLLHSQAEICCETTFQRTKQSRRDNLVRANRCHQSSHGRSHLVLLTSGRLRRHTNLIGINQEALRTSASLQCRMEDFNSETDSDYTSYWRDWVSTTLFSMYNFVHFTSLFFTLTDLHVTLSSSP